MAVVNVPDPQATVSKSVTVKAQVCVQPFVAISRFPNPIKPLKVAAATEPPVIVMLENVPAPVFNILALASPIAVAPHQVLPVSSV